MMDVKYASFDLKVTTSVTTNKKPPTKYSL